MSLEFAAGSVTVSDWPRVRPQSGGDLWSRVGICAHPNFDNEAYGDTDAWTQRVADVGWYAFRGMFASNLPHVQRTLVRAKELGLKWLATVASEKTTEPQLLERLDAIRADLESDPDSPFIGIEGINEPDPASSVQVAKTVRFQRIIWDYVQQHELNVVVLSPALKMKATRAQYQRFVDAGILGTYHAVSVHHYLNGEGDPFRPGPPDLMELRAHLDMVQEVWQCDRFWVTEGGNTNVINHPDPRRASEEASAAYSLPTILEFLSEGRVERYFDYELNDDRDPESDDNEAHFGKFRPDGSPKPVVGVLQDFLGLTRSVGTELAEVELDIVAPPGVASRVTQVPDHPPVVWLWRPGAYFDAEPVDVRIETPAGDQTAAVGGAAVSVPLGYQGSTGG